MSSKCRPIMNKPRSFARSTSVNHLLCTSMYQEGVKFKEKAFTAAATS